MAHAFAEGSVGLWFGNPAYLADRLPKIAAFQGGIFTDVFVPREATPEDMALIRSTGRPNGQKLRAQFWTTPRNLEAPTWAAQVLTDIKRLKPGVVLLNIEEPDIGLEQYIRDTVGFIRVVRPGFLLNVNSAPRKGSFLPADLFQNDPALFASEQAYFGNMEAVYSYDDAKQNLIDYGVPAEKASVMYPAACKVGGITGNQRVVTLPLGWPLRKGFVFQDDLMMEVGLL